MLKNTSKVKIRNINFRAFAHLIPSHNFGTIEEYLFKLIWFHSWKLGCIAHEKQESNHLRRNVATSNHCRTIKPSFLNCPKYRRSGGKTTVLNINTTSKHPGGKGIVEHLGRQSNVSSNRNCTLIPKKGGESYSKLCRHLRSYFNISSSPNSWSSKKSKPSHWISLYLSLKLDRHLISPISQSLLKTLKTFHITQSSWYWVRKKEETDFTKNCPRGIISGYLRYSTLQLNSHAIWFLNTGKI